MIKDGLLVEFFEKAGDKLDFSLAFCICIFLLKNSIILKATLLFGNSNAISLGVYPNEFLSYKFMSEDLQRYSIALKFSFITAKWRGAF